MDAEIMVRLVVAMLLGGAIGIEREYRSKDAGFRTHFLVSLGSALFTIISMKGFPGGDADSSRVAAQVVSGIGFLGAGTIIFQRNFIRGLTTAAGLWVTAAVGMACGTGMFAIAAATTVLVLIGLEVLNTLIRPVGTSHIHVEFRAGNEQAAKEAIAAIRASSKAVYTYSLKKKPAPGGEYCEAVIDIKLKGKNPIGRVMDMLEGFENVSVNRTE